MEKGYGEGEEIFDGAELEFFRPRSYGKSGHHDDEDPREELEECLEVRLLSLDESACVDGDASCEEYEDAGENDEER